MNGALRISVLLIVSLATAVALAVIVGMRRWGRTTNEMVARLSPIAESDVGTPPVDMGRLESVPPPVARYFAFALQPGQPPIRSAELRFTGQFAARPNVWSSFTAEQHIKEGKSAVRWTRP